MELRHKIISGMCEDVDPSLLEESGCAVCGQLTPTVQLTNLKDVQLNWDILCNDGVTRKERFHVHDPIEDVPGPVLANNCDGICISCKARMRKGFAPVHSLSNHLWAGEIPRQLQNLSFAEKMLIAKVRHNRCVVRVASGRGKMSANAIMFATPIVKLYNVLPPTKDEVSEVLAFVFLAPTRPTEQDFVRTPMLVRRQYIKDALDWLKLNHSDYVDLDISLENLNSLPEAGIPCGVDWKPIEEDKSNNIAAATSVHDQGDELGTEAGPCSFSVAGITGEEYGLADMKTLKTKALAHLKKGGEVLGVGQSDEAQSLYHNVQLYPQMFPWLFPYGKGGIGNPLHKKTLKLLLMYHDKRFQTDFYFPMIAFNDIQIKAGSSGSYLLAKSKNFRNVVERLMKIDTAVVTDLARRLEQGEHIKSKTESEQLCFDLLNELEYVGGHVQGSLTAKKYMRNEVWSLISFKGAPTWFITFSPVDNNHPLLSMAPFMV
ncbi:hypothetical protein GGX14DRAFT_537861 [Mycena pura]|uniref:Uncharacterized protein n=1 Tax=Mycena pura TaxID=153505 RepID=A0AAD6UNW9_9AGAR|nr:hypothetical protein GGX14DRAFT_537861 [Mycena pura]